MVERNEINITQIEKIGDILAKAGASPNIISGLLSSLKMIEL